MLVRRGARSGFVTVVAIGSAWVLGATAREAFATRADGTQGAVAAEHRLASEAGVEILKAGGNAVDAAVAALLAAGVVNPSSSGLGGGGFMLVYIARDRSVHAIDFRETAPQAAHRDLFLRDLSPSEREAFSRDGKVVETLSQRGGLAIAAPAEPRGFAYALERYGTMSFAEVAAPAVRLARDGFAAEAFFVDAITRNRDTLAADANLRAELLRGDGTPYAVGETVKRPMLAETLTQLSELGVESFYSGDIARDIVAATKASSGILALSDLSGYRVKERAPIASTYRGHRVYGMPPPSSGGGAIAAALLLLAPYDLNQIAASPATYLHLFAETDKAVFADRARYYGDPDMVKVPLGMLLSPARAAKIRARFSAVRPLPASTYAAGAAASDAGTSHVSVIDRDGNAVACTSSVNTAFGSKVGARGFPLNNTMDDFATKPGAANAFGLVGTEANAVAPGKRPLSSMSPTIVVGPDGRVRLVAGASGGPLIISATLQTLLNVIDLDMNVDAAVVAPRIHHQWQPDVIISEESVPAEVRASLTRRGHIIKLIPSLAATSAVTRSTTRDGAHISASSDPRKGGVPAAY
jgi:gamma-glutamyltranspeptidase/glutathione hydrolase